MSVCICVCIQPLVLWARNFAWTVRCLSFAFYRLYVLIALCPVVRKLIGVSSTDNCYWLLSVIVGAFVQRFRLPNADAVWFINQQWEWKPNCMYELAVQITPMYIVANIKSFSAWIHNRWISSIFEGKNNESRWSDHSI